MITLTISFEPGQPLEVSGPVHDKLFCYGLLEMARDAIQEHAARQAAAAPSIQIASALPPRAKSNGS